MDAEETRTREGAPWSLLLPKALFFMATVMLDSCYAFRAKFFEDVFLIPPQEFGLLVSLCAIVAFVGAWAWSHASDRCPSRWHQQVLLISIAILSTVVLVVMYALRVPFLAATDAQASTGTIIATVILLYSLYHLFSSAVAPMVDALVLEYITRYPNMPYGKQRMWGTIGYGLVSFLNGWLLDTFGYVAMFVVLVAATIIFVWVTLSFYSHIPLPAEKVIPPVQADSCEENHATNASFLTGIHELFKAPFAFFLFTILLIGIPRAMLSIYLNAVMENEFGLPKRIIAIAITLGLVFEIFFFRIGAKLRARFSPKWILLMAQSLALLRSMAYAILLHIQATSQSGTLSTPLLATCILSIELLKGISSACIQLAAVHMAADLAPTHRQSTAQGLYRGVYGGVAVALAGLLGTAVIKYFDILTLFWSITVTSVVPLFMIHFWK